MMFQIILRPHKTNKDVTNFSKIFVLCVKLFSHEDETQRSLRPIYLFIYGPALERGSRHGDTLATDILVTDI